MTWRHGERPQYAEEGAFGRFLRTLRHPLRVLAMGLAALAVTSGVLMGVGVASAVVGAVLGVVAGEIAGRSRLKLAAIATVILLVSLVSWGLASLSTGSETIPSLVGPGAALKLSGALRWGSLAFALTALLRSVAVRRPAVLALEMGAVITAVAVQFASHRDGVIARPLWISDWAWQKGIDPANVFLVIGAAAAVVLAVLLVLETRNGRSVSSLLALPALALLAVACLDVVGTPTPEAEDGLGLTDDQTGEPPHEMPEVDDPGGGGSGRADAGTGGAPEPGGDGGLPGGGQAGRDGGTPQQARDGGVGQGTGADGGGAGQGGARDAGGGGARDGGGAGGGETDAGGQGGGGATDGGAQDAGGGGGSGDGGAGGGARDAGPPPDVPPPSGGQGQQGDAPPRPPTESQLTDQGAPSNSPAPMAVVVLENDYSPPAGGYYFRQEAWSRFNGTRLVPAETDGVDDDTLADFPTRPTPVHGPPETERARVRARVALLVGHQHPFALETPVEFEPMANPNPERFQRAYRFESLAQQTDYRDLLGREAGDPEWTDEERAMYLEGHPDPRFAELAQQILDENLPEAMHSDPFARALAIKLWLDANLIYSTQHRHANAEDPTVDFLFGNRTGYCVHFAHSTVFLWRAVGIPSRVGTGYMVPEENRQGGSAILVRSGDAHAWPELYLDGVGWVVLDISAEQNLDEAGEPVDEDLQRMLGEMARDQPADPEDEIADEDEGASLLPHVDPWIAAGVLLGAILLVLYGIKTWRRLSPVFAGRRALPRVGYRALLDRMAEVGFAREYGETREQFATRVGELAPAFAKATSLHVAARLRDPATDPAEREELDRGRWRKLSRDVRKQLRGHTKWWRRLIGYLHPVSFLDAR